MIGSTHPLSTNSVANGLGLRVRCPPPSAGRVSQPLRLSVRFARVIPT